MGASQIPKNVAAALRKCCPDGVVEAFPTDDSYFHEIRDGLESDLRKIRGATLHWQTPLPETAPDGADDWDHDPLPPDDDWQSYHVFFLAPNGKEFRFEDEIEGLEQSEDPESEECITATFPGEGWIGCGVGIYLAAPFAAIDLCKYSQYEDGSTGTPQLESSDQTNERIDTDRQYRETLGANAFQKLDELRSQIAAVLLKHRIEVLESSVLDLPAPNLEAGEDVYLEGPLRVRDAFFFRGL
jgi:hypothetical protein